MKTVSGSAVLEEFDLDKAKALAGSDISLSACVHKVNDMGAFSFIHLRTARYVIQSVYSAENCTGSVEGIKEGCFVKVTGTVREEERAKNGIEIVLKTIELLHKPGYDYPLHVSKWKLGCSLDVNLDNRGVALRNPQERAVFKFQEGVVSGFRQFMIDNKFTEIHTP